MDPKLTRRALDVNWRNLAMGHEVLEWDDATLVRNTTLPQVYDANFVFNATASEQPAIDRLDPFTPPAFEARLALDGYQRTDAIVLLLYGGVLSRAQRVDIRGFGNDQSWLEFAKLKHDDWHEYAGSAKPASTGVPMPPFVTAARLKCPPVQYVMAA